jgi:hypothetical protein
MFRGLIVLSSIICIAEGIPLAKKKLWKELTTVMVLVFIAIFLGIIKVLDMPNPIDILNNLVYPFGRKVFRH